MLCNTHPRPEAAFSSLLRVLNVVVVDELKRVHDAVDALQDTSNLALSPRKDVLEVLFDLPGAKRRVDSSIVTM